VLDDSSTTQTSDRVRRLVARATSRAAIPYLLSGGFLLISVIFMGHEVVQNIKAIETWIMGLGTWGIVAFVAMFVVTTSFLMPDSILCIAAGVLFGPMLGIVAVLFGILIAAMLQFLLARRLFQAGIQREISQRPALAAIQRAVIQDEFRLQVLVRLTPVNPAILNYLLGATHVSLSGFLFACLAHMPAIMVEVYFGHASTNMVKSAEGNIKHALLEYALLFGGLAACLAVLVIVSRMARKALVEAIAESEAVADCPKRALLSEG
jgi:uncharacterized membrane protein YdjX (TVP38/TMEM64 family)